MNCQVSREDSLVHTQSVCLCSIRCNPYSRLRFLVICSYQVYSIHLMHAGGNLFGSLFQVADTVAAHSYLDGIRSRIIVHLLEADIAIREIVGIMVGILVEHLLRSIIAHGIYNKLCEVWSANLWSVCSVETW